MTTLSLPSTLRTLFRALILALLAFAIFGPLLNLLLWAFAERWYFPNKLPIEYGLTYWYRVFQPRGNALASLGTSVWIAILTVFFSLAVAVPAGYALARLKLPWRGVILLAFLLPQAVPNLPPYGDAAARGAGTDRERDLRVPRVARRVHRHVLRRRARRDDAAAPDVQCDHGRQLPNLVNHRAAVADSVDRIHARRGALPQIRRPGDGRPLRNLGNGVEETLAGWAAEPDGRRRTCDGPLRASTRAQPDRSRLHSGAARV